LPETTPFAVEDIEFEDPKTGQPKRVRLKWKDTVADSDRLQIEAKALPFTDFKSNISSKLSKAKRCEELGDAPHAHIWEEVNEHLGTNAKSFPELLEQMGIARFGHSPSVGDVFCGSGQIPYEAARLGCNVLASDLNPIACLLTWGAFNVVGASSEIRTALEKELDALDKKISAIIAGLGTDSDNEGWRAKAYLYCLETICPETGWKVPLLPTCVISMDYLKIVRLVPNHATKTYELIVDDANPDELAEAKIGTVRKGYCEHSPNGTNTYRFKLGSVRGDFSSDKGRGNRLRLWEKSDFAPRPEDIFQERLYCVQWMKEKNSGKGFDLDIRSVTEADIIREKVVMDYVRSNLSEWQEKGFVPDMMIEKGDETERLYRERGWTHWHHLFNPRQLLVAGLLIRNATPRIEYSVCLRKC
jgi:putative DNA methylase